MVFPLMSLPIINGPYAREKGFVTLDFRPGKLRPFTLTEHIPFDSKWQ